MEFTGERMVPERADPATFWHHVYRYKFAIPYCRGRRVLDVACGEGYGCASIKEAGAASVTGVDISGEACRHARDRYGVNAIEGSALDLPLPDASVDVVVSFETIEHLPDPARFIDECARVLAPGGRLVISSPNRDLYRLRNGLNPFHCSELSEREFTHVVQRGFEIESIHGQYPELRPAGLHSLLMWPYAAWTLVRGMNRLRRLVRGTLGRYYSSVPNIFYDNPSLAVNGKLPREQSIWNPNIVRPRRPSPHLEFVFLLVVARLRA